MIDFLKNLMAGPEEAPQSKDEELRLVAAAFCSVLLMLTAPQAMKKLPWFAALSMKNLALMMPPLMRS